MAEQRPIPLKLLYAIDVSNWLQQLVDTLHEFVDAKTSPRNRDENLIVGLSTVVLEAIACLCCLGIFVYFKRYIRQQFERRGHSIGLSSYAEIHKEVLQCRVRMRRPDEALSSFGVVGGYLQLKNIGPKSVLKLLRLSGATKSSWRLHNITTTFASGKFTAIMGASGAGKTSLLKILLGMETLTRGNVVFNGKELSSHAIQSLQARLGYVPQSDTLRENLTVAEILYFEAKTRLRERVSSQLIEKFIHAVVLVLDLKGRISANVDHLSGGERKRLSIAMELLSLSSIVLLDEPTTGLDASKAHALCLMLRNMTRELEKLTIIAVIHQPSSKIFEIFDEVLLLGEGGRLIYKGAYPIEFFTLLGYFCEDGSQWCDYMLELISDCLGDVLCRLESYLAVCGASLQDDMDHICEICSYQQKGEFAINRWFKRTSSFQHFVRLPSVVGVSSPSYDNAGSAVEISDVGVELLPTEASESEIVTKDVQDLQGSFLWLYILSLPFQLRSCFLIFVRTIIQFIRGYIPLLIEFAMVLCGALLVGVVFVSFPETFDCTLHGTQEDNVLYITFLGVLVLGLLASSSSVRFFSYDMPITARDCRAGISPMQIFLSRIILQWFHGLILSTMFALIVYTFVYSRAIIFYSLVGYSALFWSCSGLGVLSSMFFGANSAISVATVCFFVFLLFSGIFPQYQDISDGNLPIITGFLDFSIARVAIELLYVPEFLAHFDQDAGTHVRLCRDAYLDRWGFHQGHFRTNVWYLFRFGMLCRFLAFGVFLLRFSVVGRSVSAFLKKHLILLLNTGRLKLNSAVPEEAGRPQVLSISGVRDVAEISTEGMLVLTHSGLVFHVPQDCHVDCPNILAVSSPASPERCSILGTHCLLEVKRLVCVLKKAESCYICLYVFRLSTMALLPIAEARLALAIYFVDCAIGDEMVFLLTTTHIAVFVFDLNRVNANSLCKIELVDETAVVVKASDSGELVAVAYQSGVLQLFAYEKKVLQLIISIEFEHRSRVLEMGWSASSLILLQNGEETLHKWEPLDESFTHATSWTCPHDSMVATSLVIPRSIGSQHLLVTVDIASCLRVWLLRSTSPTCAYTMQIEPGLQCLRANSHFLYIVYPEYLAVLPLEACLQGGTHLEPDRPKATAELVRWQP